MIVKGARVKMDAVKFAKLTDTVFLVASEVVNVKQGDDAGKSFVWLVTEDTATRSQSRQLRRTAWVTDLIEL